MKTLSPIWRLVVPSTLVIVPLGEPSGPGKGTSFYCIHPIAGDVTSFNSLARLLRSDIKFYGVQVPLAKLNTRFASSIEMIAEHHLEEIVRFQPEGPLSLGGWSVGAIVALEMAQRLRKLGRDVPLLVAFDGAPCNTKAELSNKFLHGMKIVYNFPRWLSDLIRNSRSDGGFIVTLKRKWRLYSTLRNQNSTGTMDPEVVVNILDKDHLSAKQADFISAFYNASLRYIPSNYSGDVLVFETKTQPLMRQRNIGAAWKCLAPSLEIITLKGNHSKIFDSPALEKIAGHLKSRLSLRAT